MKRTYTDGTETDSADFFVGTEVERTPAYGLKTLFVVGLQDPNIIESYYAGQGCEHIFFGANHSYDPVKNGNWGTWDAMIMYFLKKDMLCTLDIPADAANGSFLDGGLTEYNNFIPQIRIPLPYIQQWNYNTMIKIDDSDFNATNPGVWCHSLHNLMNRDKFTNWAEYASDDVIE